MCAKEFVPKIAVTVLDVDKIEASFPRRMRRSDEFSNDPANLGVRKQGIIRSESQPPIQNRVMMKNPRLGLSLFVWTAISPGVRQLQSDQRAVVGSRRLSVSFK
jgi:hypothetical protein